MSTLNLCFRAKKRKNMYIPVNPSFTIYKWGVRGSGSHGHVIVMASFSELISSKTSCIIPDKTPKNVASIWGYRFCQCPITT